MELNERVAVVVHPANGSTPARRGNSIPGDAETPCFAMLLIPWRTFV